MNAYPPPPPSFYSHQQPSGMVALPGLPPSAPTPQPHLQQSYPQQSVQNAPTHMRPPPLDTSFIYNDSSTYHVQYHYQQQQKQQQQQQQQEHAYNNNNTVYPNTPSLTSRPQSTYYQTPPSSNGSNNNNNNSSSTYDSNIRSRRISVTTGDNGWKVGGAGGKRSSIQQQPRAAVVDGADFHERRMRRQSTGATIFEPPITPAYTPKTPGNSFRDSHNGYFSQTHAIMSPQELAAPTMHPQPITKRESFVGGFVLPPAYPPYGSQQPIQQQRPQTPHTPHNSQKYPTHTQQQYPQTPHTPHHSQQYPAQTSHTTHAQQQYPQIPHTPHNSQQYSSQPLHSIHAQQQNSQTSHTTQYSQHRVSQQHSYHQNIHHQQYQQQPATSTAAQHYTDDGNSYNRNNNSHQQQQQQQQQQQRNRSTSASSYYRNDNYYNTSTNDEITFSDTTGAEYSAISGVPPTERARSVKSVRSVKSSKSLKSAGGTFAAEESRQLPAKKRQIVVQSINVGHRVHIDVAANETGQSLAEKIHQIATFRTRKIISITTATGRKIPLDRRPVFDGWADIQNFENEEEWDVEWTSLDKSMMDRFFSKVVQVGEGGSTRNEEVRCTYNNNAKNEMQQ